MERSIGKQVPAIQPVPGEIKWYEVSRSRAVRKIVERSVARWVALHRLSGGASEQARFRAVLQKEGEGHLVHCQIEVSMGPKVWSASRYGQGLQQALSDCLAHMTPSIAQMRPALAMA